jgi:hypothetical protein
VACHGGTGAKSTYVFEETGQSSGAFCKITRYTYTPSVSKYPSRFGQKNAKMGSKENQYFVEIPHFFSEKNDITLHYIVKH